jgi:signal transduction histidine kinase
MKVALKVVLATVLGTLVILITFGWIRSQREVQLFDSDMRRDHRLIGDTLAVCVATTWSAAGAERAVDLIVRADAERPGVRIAWLHRDGTMIGAPPRFAPLVREAARIEDVVLPDPHMPGHSFLVTRVPVRNQGHFLGTIEIAESLDTRDGYVRASIWNTVGATLAMVVVSALVVLLFGVWIVGKPLRELANKAKRVGLGDLSGPLELRQRDEIGQLAREVNAMCERLEEANAKTHQEAAARLRALEQLRHADRLITVGRLAAGIAHELGTPLNVIAGRVKMLRRGNIEPAVAEDYLAAVAEQTERIIATVRQLMDFARQRERKVAAADVLAIARSVVRLVEPMAKKRGVVVRVTTFEPVLVLGDAMRLEQVLSNLTVNAIHACVEGGRVELSCETQLTDGVGEPNSRGTLAVVRVSDDGHGMDAQTVERIFEPFFTTKDVGQGTGLGLSVAHGIVQEHGGRITVQSVPGCGSTFSVFLPSAAVE